MFYRYAVLACRAGFSRRGGMIKVRSNGGSLTLTEQMAGEMDHGVTKRLASAALMRV